MPDTIKRKFVTEVDQITIELVLMFQVLFHQQPQVEYMFSGIILCALKPACSSYNICSAWFTSPLRITRSMTLLA